jgi:hypothetical protein
MMQRTREANARRAMLRLRLVVLTDHARLPWRFFGRLTTAAQTGL